MKRAFNIFWSITFLLLFIDCDDIFEENISEDIVTVLSPKQDDKIVGNTVTFMWDALDGADKYNVQVSRLNSLEIVLDSLTENSLLSVPIQSGEYSWRVRGENFAYQSGYSLPIEFNVQTTEDLSGQNVFLNSPSDNFFTKNNTAILVWSSIEAADHYVLQLSKTSGNNSSVVLEEDSLSNTSYTLESGILESDAIYKWSVKAVNENSETPYKTRTLFLDTTAPNPPSLISPNHTETVSTTVSFSWNSGQNIGIVQSPLSSHLEIATDENFSSIIQLYSIDGGSAEKQHVFSTTGIYYWRVTIEDEAGNQSLYSSTRSITVE